MLRHASTAVRLALVNLGSQVGRSSYLTITLAVAVTAWLGLSALASPFAHADIPFAGRVVVLNPRPGSTLPIRYADRIARMPGVTSVSYQNFSPVVCRGNSTAATLNGFGGAGALQRLTEAGVDAASIKAWEDDPLGVLVGADLAASCGWKPGMAIEPPDFAGAPVQIHIIGVFRSAQSYHNQTAFAHYAYINRLQGLVGTRDHVNFITANAADSHQTAQLATRIEADFAHDDPPVEARTSAMADSTLARFGRVQDLLAWVMAAIFACTLLVLTSVLAHTAAQRRARSAVLQVLGFQRAVLFAAFTIECALIVLLAAAVGIGAGRVTIHLLAPSVTPLLGQFAAPPWAYAYLPLWLFALLAAGLSLPALIMARTRPNDYSAS